jgi:hypothetical protein
MSAPLVENPANVHPSSGLSDGGLPAVVCSVQTTQTVSAVIKLGKAAQRRLDLKARDVWQDWVAVCLALWAIMMQALAEAGTDAPHGGK